MVLATLSAGFSEAAIATGLVNPTAMEIAPDGRVWVLGQGGSVEVFHPGSPTGSTALTIPAGSINASGERGLLGVAFDPSYDIRNPAPDYVYLYYTSNASPGPHNRVSRFAVDNARPDRPTLSGEVVLVDLDPLSSATNHNGGAIHFGPDGKLYVAVGENGNGANAQSLTNRLGKILRYNADGTIPSDNPSTFPGIAGSTAGPNRAIWAVGLRNPFTFTFQPGTGRMHINDVGQNSREEIDVGVAGANYGWPGTEGDFDPAAFPAFTRPFYAYSHGSGTFQGFAITGGAFYNPTAPGVGQFPSRYVGDYFYADFVNRWINVVDTSTRSVTRFASDIPSPVDLRVAADGSLLYLARDSGTVERVTSLVKVATPPASFDGSGRTNLAVYLPAIGAFAYRPSDPTLGDQIVPFGLPGAGRTIPAAADYSGSGRSQIAAYLPSLGIYAIRSGSGPDRLISFGIAGTGQSLPTPADYDGDGRADIAVYLPALGAFGIRPSGGGADRIVGIGIAGIGRSIPAPGDYDGDGRADLMVYLPTSGDFGLRPSSGGADRIIPFGIAGGSIPAPGDYDGDGKTDLAVSIPSMGLFAYRPSGGGPDVVVPIGTPGTSEIPVPGDYTGSGRTQVALYDPARATFTYRPANSPDVTVTFGSAGALPVAATGAANTGSGVSATALTATATTRSPTNSRRTFRVSATR